MTRANGCPSQRACVQSTERRVKWKVGTVTSTAEQRAGIHWMEQRRTRPRDWVAMQREGEPCRLRVHEDLPERYRATSRRYQLPPGGTTIPLSPGRFEEVREGGRTMDAQMVLCWAGATREVSETCELARQRMLVVQPPAICELSESCGPAWVMLGQRVERLRKSWDGSGAMLERRISIRR